MEPTFNLNFGNTMEKTNNIRFLVDVDDVLRNLVPNMIRLYNKEFRTDMKYDDVGIYYVNQSFPKLAERYGDATKWFFQDHGHELFAGSEAIDGAVEAVNRLRDYGTVHIVTKQRSLENKMDTLQWLDDHGVMYDSVSFVTHKSTVCCDVFIDDFHENFIGCGSEGAVGILIEAPYNRKLDMELLRQSTNFSRILRYNSISEFVSDLEKGKFYFRNVKRYN